jgi:hypothetical protein
MEGPGSKALVRELVAALLRDCKSAESAYALEELVPTLVPALVHVLGLLEAKAARAGKGGALPAAERDVRPLNSLAQFLMRNNPLAPGGACGKVAAQRELVREAIVLEREALGAARFLKRLKGAGMEQEILGLKAWPLTATGKVEHFCALHGPRMQRVLGELEGAAGLAGLRDELTVALEVLDVRKSGAVAWPAFCALLAQWLALCPEPGRAKMTRGFRAWLRKETRDRVAAAALAYFAHTSQDCLFERAAREQGAALWPDVARLLAEVKHCALGWGEDDCARVEPEEVLDAREQKCSDDLELTMHDFAQLLSAYYDRLAAARVDHFVA